MLNTRPYTLTRVLDGDVMTLVFYSDTGCLRIADSLGVVRHELRPPHSWFAIASASRGVRAGTHALSEGLSTLLHDFCVKRPRWLCDPVRMFASAHVLPIPAANSLALQARRGDMHACPRSLTMEAATAQ